MQRAMCRFASRYGQKTIATCIPHGVRPCPIPRDQRTYGGFGSFVTLWGEIIGRFMRLNNHAALTKNALPMLLKEGNAPLARKLRSERRHLEHK